MRTAQYAEGTIGRENTLRYAPQMVSATGSDAQCVHKVIPLLVPLSRHTAPFMFLRLAGH